MLKSPEISLPKVSLKEKVLRTIGGVLALYAINPSQPTHAEVTHNENDKKLVREYPECNGNNTQWVLEFTGVPEDQRYTVLNLGLLSQCGSVELDNTLRFEIKAEDLRPNTFFSEKYSAGPVRGISCPEGFHQGATTFTGITTKAGFIKVNHGGNPIPEYLPFIDKDANDQELELTQKCVYVYRWIDPSMGLAAVVPYKKVILEIEAPRSLDEFKASFGAARGDGNYREKYDKDNNDIIDIRDFSLLRDRLAQ